MTKHDSNEHSVEPTSAATPLATASDGRPAESSLAVTCIRGLMDRHGLAKYRQSAWLAEALGLSYSQAHRRMTGASPWTLEDMARVAARFGETLADIVGPEGARASVEGTLHLGAARLPCQLWLGTAMERAPSADTVVAVQTSAGWSAVIAAEATEGKVYKIERLEAKPAAASRRLVAVLDDDHDLTDSIVTHFESSGYAAAAFYRTADLLASASIQRFDGYVVDWIVGDATVLELIAALRERDAKAPIIVLTAQVMAGVVDEADIADAVGRYGLVFHEKPVRTSILVATLSRAFAPSG